MKKHRWTAELIKKARIARKLTQADLAEAMGCRQQTVSEWETGIYLPQNAYNRLLDLFFGEKKDG